VITNVAVLWFVAQCTLVLWLVTLMLEAAKICGTLVNFYQTTRRYTPEDSHLHNLLFSLALLDQIQIGLPLFGLFSVSPM
jgi:hypothetical protein